ncbi:Putative Pc22g16190 protein [[Torrubiella] hemipterigena]|uniref:Putative Pc22g16190 protein n=1 Tax=[Torrubiella] hemipterigena TaxID=1531966 RepID=A0A0A1SLT2_9HYPO|nr:Putative Pc22g16190 protein [[Torrubiella] hemipterigena]
MSRQSVFDFSFVPDWWYTPDRRRREDYELGEQEQQQEEQQQPPSNDTPIILEPPPALALTPPTEDDTVSAGFSPPSRAGSHLTQTSVSGSNLGRDSSSVQCPPTPDDGANADAMAGRAGVIRPIKAEVHHDSKSVFVKPGKGRELHRKLRGIHIAMIAVNATLGSGLYWRGGQVLELGGPLSTLLAFLLPGILAMAVMQCITEMLCIWPIPGALSAYVSEFVDVELGIVVGLLYWFTYAASFAALIATCAAEMHYWGVGGPAFDGTVLYFLIPLFLILLNCFSVIIYGWLEVITSFIKLSFLLAVIVIMVLVNLRGDHAKGIQYWSNAVEYDTDAANSWGNAFIMCISIASFAYVGVEVVAASALEARWPTVKRDGPERADSNLSNSSTQEPVVGQTLKFSSIFIPFIITAAYVIAGLLASFNISRSDYRLPRLSWRTKQPESSLSNSTTKGSTISAFVIISKEAHMGMMDQLINVFLVFTVMSCASTNLYVASRTLFGLTARLDEATNQSLMFRFLAWFGKTNRFRVPMRAVIFSAVSFCWVPFLQLDGESRDISTFIEILSTMATNSVIIVWAFECLAFIRYYHCLERHKEALQEENVAQVDRWGPDYPYRSPFQPIMAYLALAGCVFVLVVANSSLMWKGFHLTPFLSTFLLQIVFVFVYLALKFRSRSWAMVDLSNPDVVARKITKLNDIRLQTLDDNENIRNQQK